MYETTDELRIFRETVSRAAKEKIAPLAAGTDERRGFQPGGGISLLGPGLVDAGTAA